MLATMNPSADAPADLDDRLCPGCKRSAVTEQGGLVVAFGQSFFHVDCFKCAKCGDQVTADTNLLLLSDGSPICANCSYSCNVCHNPILDEAIMTGDDSYHAHCFKCKVCKNRIDELVFAKTSQGIYCMKCHNERMIKIRKHTQKKAEREKAAAGAPSGSTSSRERDARSRPQPSPGLGSNDFPSSSASASSPQTPRNRGPDAVRSPPKQRTGPYISDAFESDTSRQLQNGAVAASSSQPLPSPAFQIALPEHDELPATPVVHTPSDARSNLTKKTTLPLPPSTLSESTSSSRRKSFDDGVRPLDALYPQDDSVPAASGLAAPTSRKDKRRSINPGLSLNNFEPIAPGPRPASPTLSPLATTFKSSSRPSTPRDSSGNTSPQHEPYVSSSRPNSASSNTHMSSSSSPRTPVDRDLSPDQTVVMSPMSRPNVILDAVPPKKAAQSSSLEYRLSVTMDGRSSSDGLLPSRNPRSSSDIARPPSRSRSDTPSSLSRRADVPQGIESGTDTDAEGDSYSHTSHSESPPPPPPKELKSYSSHSPSQRHSPLNDENEASNAFQPDSSDDMSESSPVEHTSHSTFIAPALPPIRFSMTTADFSDLFKQAEAQKSTSLKQLANISEDLDGSVPMTPPPTATSLYSTASTITTPTSDSTFTVNQSVESFSSRTSEDGMLPVPAPRFVSPAPRLQSLGKKAAAALKDDDDHPGPESRMRSSSESRGQLPPTRVTITRADSASAAVPIAKVDQASMVTLRLNEALADARERGATQLRLDRAFVEAVLGAMEARDSEFASLKAKFDGVKRASKQYIDGLTVAQTEYDSELKARRDAEAEVTRLRVLLSGQAARLTALSGDTRRQELRQQMSKELNENLSDLEHDLSKLKVERDMALAEVEELAATKQSVVEAPPSNLGRSLTTRLDTIKKQYQRDLIPLREERENLAREIAELKGVRDVFLEETTVLNARNEELAQLSAQYARRMVAIPETPQKPQPATPMRSQQAQQSSQLLQTMTPSATGSSSASDDALDARFRVQVEAPTPSKGKVFKWPGSRTREPARDAISPANTPAPEPRQNVAEPRQPKSTTSSHNFQQLSVLRFTRCDHCADKMWGSQLRCTTCNISVHVRCVNHVQVQCSQQSGPGQEEELPPSMFGRDLTEQVHADAAQGGDRQVPIIVVKCIDAVESLAMEYEGIYRKTGGSGQSKAITQLFERGDYAAFDLCDSDRFNDICSVTSVLKTYFRSLPIPLLTFDLHDHFMSAVQIREPATKNNALLELVNKLPAEHYFTLRRLMVHLHGVHELSDKNLMTARNLGVVFGPTLMRSRDPGAEFSDMAGKALSVEWFIENAPQIFPS
ncbi:signal transducer [Favolaschia claudopus]|uniref:Signal transducer n=1 Tax=Favolaschia claudopus TaxID=2862362 RepID=A0AAW0DYT7_9AGAR